MSKATLAQLMKINILLYIIHNIILDPDEIKDDTPFQLISGFFH